MCLCSTLRDAVLLRCDTDFGGSTWFGCGTKTYNSVIWLNWVMFDSKTILYLKFWVWWRRLNFWEANFCTLICKSTSYKKTIFLVLSQKAHRNAPISQPVSGVFKKPYRLFLSSEYRLGDNEVKWYLLPKTAVPRHRDSKPSQVGQDRPFFGFWLGHRRYWEEV